MRSSRRWHAQRGQEFSHIGVAEHLAGGGVAGRRVGEEHRHGGLDLGRLRGAERIAEPARDLECGERGEAFFNAGGAAFAPDLGCIGTVPGGGVDEGERGGALRIEAGKGLGDAATHGTAGDSGRVPAQVIE